MLQEKEVGDQNTDEKEQILLQQNNGQDEFIVLEIFKDFLRPTDPPTDRQSD